MDSAEVRFLTRGLEIEADPDAGPRFRTAAVRLGEVEPDGEARRPVAADAARLLVGLALGSAADELGELLIPDPAVPDNRWTVSCFEMGGLTPVAVRDFDDPVEAVVTVSACPDEAHVAAELVASNENGLRWTALWRTDDHISFQLPRPRRRTPARRPRKATTARSCVGALQRWQARLDEWSGRDTTAAPADSAARNDDVGAATGARRAHATTRPMRGCTRLEQRLSGIEATLAEHPHGAASVRPRHRGSGRRCPPRRSSTPSTSGSRRSPRSCTPRSTGSALKIVGRDAPDRSRPDDEDEFNVIDMRGSTR